MRGMRAEQSSSPGAVAVNEAPLGLRDHALHNSCRSTESDGGAGEQGGLDLALDEAAVAR